MHQRNLHLYFFSPTAARAVSPGSSAENLNAADA